LRIALDATYAVGDQLTGVGVYCREMLDALADRHPETRFVHCFRPHRWWKGIQQTRGRNKSVSLMLDGPLGRLWSSTGDLFHGLNQRLPQSKLRKAVTTFHDLFVLTGDYSTPAFRKRFSALAKDAAERSDLIICVSEFTATQVEQLLNVERSRLRVVHHGVHRPDVVNGPDVRDAATILSVGSIQHRKNTMKLVEAFELLFAKAWPTPPKLILAGGFGFGAAEIMTRIEASPAREHIELPGFVSSDRLTELYRSATILSFPSVDEGFGIPILEAMAHGLPVVTSNRSACAEVAADGAIQVDPTDEFKLAQAMGNLLEDPSARRSWMQRGLHRVRRFNWPASARYTWEVYRELIQLD
jgi:glycosyltransferase involved in cell wall biosynthesis